MPAKPPLATIAHDLKTPVTGIQMSLHLLEEQKVGPLNETQEKLIKRALGDCQNLISIIGKYCDGSPTKES